MSVKGLTFNNTPVCNTVWWVIFEHIIFREKSKEGSRSNFLGFYFRDWRAVGHTPEIPWCLRVRKLYTHVVVINLRRVKFRDCRVNYENNEN